MNRFQVYRIIVMAITVAIVVVAIVGFAIRDLGFPALVAFLVLLVARLVVGVPLNREQKRRLAELKAANGGALPIPYPARARRYLIMMITVFAGLGVLAVIGGLVLQGDQGMGLVLFVLGGSFELTAAVVAITGLRLFRAREKADRAMADPTATDG